MPDLEMLLRDVRPVPDGAWAARLDARVSARFPGPVPRWKAALTTVRVHFLAIGAVGAVAALCVAVVLAGVSSHGSSDSASNRPASLDASGGGSAKSAPPPAARVPAPMT